MNIFTSFLIVATLFISTASADIFLYPTKKVRTVVVCAHGVNCARAVRVFELARKYYLERLNLDLEPVFTTRIPQDMSGEPMERMVKWLTVTQEVREQNNAQMTLVFLESFPSSVNVIDFKWEDVLGMASGIGNVGNSESLAWIKVIGSDFISSRIAIHEIGHLLGATHSNFKGIMAPSVDYAQSCTELSAESIDQIQKVIQFLP